MSADHAREDGDDASERMLPATPIARRPWVYSSTVRAVRAHRNDVRMASGARRKSSSHSSPRAVQDRTLPGDEHVLFEFTRDHTSDVVDHVLAGYQGFLVADAHVI